MDELRNLDKKAEAILLQNKSDLSPEDYLKFNLDNFDLIQTLIEKNNENLCKTKPQTQNPFAQPNNKPQLISKPSYYSEKKPLPKAPAFEPCEPIQESLSEINIPVKVKNQTTIFTIRDTALSANSKVFGSPVITSYDPGQLNRRQIKEIIKNNERNSGKVDDWVEPPQLDFLKILEKLRNLPGIKVVEYDISHLLRNDGHDGTGFEKTVLDRLKPRKYQPGSSVTSCLECKSDFTVDKPVCFVPCGHAFHYDCIFRSLTKSKICPYKCVLTLDDFNNFIY